MINQRQKYYQGEKDYRSGLHILVAIAEIITANMRKGIIEASDYSIFIPNQTSAVSHNIMR